MYKVAKNISSSFRHIRNLAVQYVFKDDKHGFVEEVDEEAVGLFGRLMAATELVFEQPAHAHAWENKQGIAALADEATRRRTRSSRPKEQILPKGGQQRRARTIRGGGAAHALSLGQARISDYQKWACRHLCANPDSWGLMMLVGHCSSMSGRPFIATQEYSRAVAECPGHPLSRLCLGVSLLSSAMSRTNLNRHETVLRGLVALRKYFELRSTMRDRVTGIVSDGGTTYLAEAWFNVGRGYHQLGLDNLAQQCYTKCLRTFDTLERKELAEVRRLVLAEEGVGRFSELQLEEDGFGEESAVVIKKAKELYKKLRDARVDHVAIRRSCAYNLWLIYQASGNGEKGREILEKYLTIE